MTSALIYTPTQMAATSLRADLEASGISVLATLQEIHKLVQSVAIHAPDVVVCDEPFPTKPWFEAIHMLEKTVACPVLVFTSDSDAKNIEKSTECGIHVYVINAYSANRLRPLIQLAQARFHKDQQQRRAYDDMATRFEERKVVDQAKGILMRAQQISDDDAFRVLRTTAMSSNQRMGQLSQQVIQSARFAEALNRSGQLRMLSQRLVKLHLLRVFNPQSARYAELLQESIDRIDGNFALLRKTISLPTFGDLLDPVEKSWAQLKAALPTDASPAVEDQAEALLLGAERLTTRLEASGQASPLHLLNLAGRQRMLSQRYAKFTLQALAAGPAGDAAKAGMLATQTEFETALTALNTIPLSTAAIYATLAEAGVTWLKMVAAARDLQKSSARNRTDTVDVLAQGSETLLGLFDQLADHYERSLEMLIH